MKPPVIDWRVKGRDVVNDRAPNLTDAIWWEEAFTIGATTFEGTLRPHDAAAQQIVVSILTKAGFVDLFDALADLASRHEHGGTPEEFDTAIAHAALALARARGQGEASHA